jgi:hypothetical protein
MPIRLSATRLDLGNARLDNANLRGYAETTNTLGNVSGSTAIDLSLGTVITATITAATTWSVTNVPSSTQFVSFTLVLTNGGRFAQTWMSGAKWQNSIAPTLCVIGTDVLTFFPTDGGASRPAPLAIANSSVGANLFMLGGRSIHGQLGLGNTVSRSSPVQLAGTWFSSGFAAISRYLSSAIRADSSLWMWGRGGSGQMGAGDTTDRSSPVQTPGTWSFVTLRDNGVAALRPDSSLWVWGSNSSSSYILGIGDTAPRSSPVQLAGIWSQVNIGGGNHAAGIKQGGSLYVWGNGGSGVLGLGHTTLRSQPTQLAGVWTAVTLGSNMSLGIKSGGSLWSWGGNNNGQLGLGLSTNGTVYHSSPVQIAGTWMSVQAGKRSVFAQKQDGSLWTWGYNNSFAQLGLGDTTNRSSPVQVPGTWGTLVMGGYISAGLRP